MAENGNIGGEGVDGLSEVSKGNFLVSMIVIVTKITNTVDY